MLTINFILENILHGGILQIYGHQNVFHTSNIDIVSPNDLIQSQMFQGQKLGYLQSWTKWSAGIKIPLWRSVSNVRRPRTHRLSETTEDTKDQSWKVLLQIWSFA